MKHCLIVDGSSVIRKVANRILSGSDLVVLEAATAGEAIAICASETPDIVVVDARLPDMASDELIRRLVALNPHFKPQIVICMTEFDVGTIMRARRAGARGHILKPFNRSQLLDGFRNLDLAA